MLVAFLSERSDADVRELEGLQPIVGPLRGANPQLPITIEENNLKFYTNLQTGHKTGFYLASQSTPWVPATGYELRTKSTSLRKAMRNFDPEISGIHRLTGQLDTLLTRHPLNVDCYKE